MINHESFNDGEVNEMLRWKDLSFHALIQNLEMPLSFHKSVVLAGGVYTSWHHKEKIKDIDVFILNDGHDAAILNYLKSLVGKIFTMDSFKNVTEYKRDNPNINDVYNAESVVPNAARYQFIFTKYEKREDLIKHFDYLHCTPNYWNSNLYVRKDAFEAIRDKILVVNNKDNQTEWRKDKFLKQRGFKEVVRNVDTGKFVSWGPYLTNIAQNV